MTTRRKLALSILGATLLAGAWLLPSASFAQTEELDAVKISPDTTKVLFENQFVRTLEIRVPPGHLEKMHKHARGITVALTDYDNETKTREGKVTKGHTKFGETKWVEPVVHEARNTGTTEQHVIRIELK
jgi:hypothetical protein